MNASTAKASNSTLKVIRSIKGIAESISRRSWINSLKRSKAVLLGSLEVGSGASSVGIATLLTRAMGKNGIAVLFLSAL
jgi:hypothetical protein